MYTYLYGNLFEYNKCVINRGLNRETRKSLLMKFHQIGPWYPLLALDAFALLLIYFHIKFHAETILGLISGTLTFKKWRTKVFSPHQCRYIGIYQCVPRKQN